MGSMNENVSHGPIWKGSTGVITTPRVCLWRGPILRVVLLKEFPNEFHHRQSMDGVTGQLVRIWDGD